jgi:hypothetical protein
MPEFVDINMKKISLSSAYFHADFRLPFPGFALLTRKNCNAMLTLSWIHPGYRKCESYFFANLQMPLPNRGDDD